MSFAKFFKDALLPVAVWACGVLLSCFVLTVAGASTSIVVVAVGVSFIFGMLGIVIEYARRRRFLRQLERAAEELESPAWVQEMVQCPTYAEGELEYEVLRRVGKAACDEVAEGRRQTDDYRDYIESWVHEAKLPLAAAHLILENLDGSEDDLSRVDDLGRELARVERYIDQALYYARSEVVERDYLIRRWGLKTLVTGAIKANARELIAAHVAPVCGNLDFEVFTDEKWLEFILGQLIQNSIKYAREDGAKIVFSGALLDEGLASERIELTVADNGCGIAPEELPTAFLRHATSKLRTAEDLAKIGTLGFRGEALAAISAVSRVDVLTRRPGDTTGSAIHGEGGHMEPVREEGAPEGTTIRVSDLFYNTPARLKFMKKDSAETAAVAGLMQHLALSHPDVSFKFIKDGQESLHTPGDGKLESAVYAALGREFAKTLVPVQGRGGDIEVRGFVTAPVNGRGSRSMQVFFVNGRFIKSQLLTAALEEGYRNQLLKGRFPGCVLEVLLPVTAVDVNVHPAKTQVKFAKEHDVFDAVFHTVMDALDARGGAVTKPAPPPVWETQNPRQDFFQSMDAKAYREQGTKPAAAPTIVKSLTPAQPPKAAQPAFRPQSVSPAAPVKPSWNTEWSSTAKVADSVPPIWPPRDTVKAAPASALGKAPASVTAKPAEPVVPVPEKTVEPAPAPKPFVPAIPAVPSQQTAMELPGQETVLPEAAPWRIAGEVLNTYIICEDDAETLWLIDKHAAHERMNFDRLMTSKEPPMRQTLLQPIAVEPGKEDAALLLDNLELLEQFGFGCEDFGDGAILVREVPADLDAADTAATLEEFAQNLRTGRNLDEKREALLHTMACKAAIKGGWTSDPAELKILVEKVQSGEVRYCPHGRPVVVKVTKYELEKLFKRA